MAKKPEFKLTYPSRFGSHASMIEEGPTEALGDPKLVVLKDEFGEYTTERDRLDSGLADPNRYKVERLGRLFAGHKKEET